MRMFLILFCAGVLEVIAFVNSYIVNLKGATIDAERFIEGAAEWARSGHWELVFDSAFYRQFVGTIFLFFGESEFKVAQVNIAALIVATVFFHRLIEELVAESSPYLTIPFMLWPSMLTRATTALREPLLVLASVLTVYALVRHVKTGRASDLAHALLWLACGAFFHKAYAVVFVVLGAAATVFSGWLQAKAFSFSDLARRSAMLVAGALLVLLVVNRAGATRGLMPLVAALTSDTERIEQIVSYKGGRAFRTTYDAPINVSSPVALLASLPKNWLFYNFKPFPWNVSSVIDAYAAIEASFRALGFVALMLLLIYSPPMRRPLAAAALVHLTLMAIWAAGTANYGTASRHHLTTNWLFIVYVAGYYQLRRQSEGIGTCGWNKEGGDDLAIPELPSRP